VSLVQKQLGERTLGNTDISLTG